MVTTHLGTVDGIPLHGIEVGNDLGTNGTNCNLYFPIFSIDFRVYRRNPNGDVDYTSLDRINYNGIQNSKVDTTVIGKDTYVYKATQSCTHSILNGVVVSCDPSIGSTSSLPGYAVYRAGVLIESGTLSIEVRGSIPARLNQLAIKLRQLYNKYLPDVLVYEEIPAQRHGGSAVSHASLLKACGVVLSVPGPEHYVGIMPVTWKRLTSPGYIKSDEQDAIEIGRIVIELAKEIENGTEAKKKTRNNKKES